MAGVTPPGDEAPSVDPADPGAVRRHFLAWRGVTDPCPECSGAGCKRYGSSATWRGGLGQAAFTVDVCDRCWGTGDRARCGYDLRALERKMDALVEVRAGDLLGARLGASFGYLGTALGTLADELDRLARGRRPRPEHFAESAAGLARLVRELIAAPRPAPAPTPGERFALAVALHEQLFSARLPGLISVGLGDESGRDELIVYVRKGARLAPGAVPGEHGGLPVRVVRLTSMVT